MKRPTDSETERWLRAQLRFLRSQLRDTFAGAPAAMALLSGPDHRFVFANSAYLKMVGRRQNELSGKRARDVFPELVEQGFLELLDQVFLAGEAFVASERVVILTRAGINETVYVDFTYYPMRNLAGKVEGILFQGIDVTEQVLARSQLESRVSERTAELHQAKQNLRLMNQKLMAVQEEERRHLALELHDSVGQMLAALQWKLISAQENLYASAETMAGYIAACLAFADDISKEIRAVIYVLRPPLLDEEGLSSALRSYGEEMRERTGVAVTLDIDFDLGRFPQALELAVFRIVQEALTNVHRHARTSEVFVRIHRDSTLLLVEIEDRGRGISQFTSVARQNTGLGLRGMRERVNQLSGEFVVESGRGGTTVKATFPIPDATNSDAWSEV